MKKWILVLLVAVMLGSVGIAAWQRGREQAVVDGKNAQITKMADFVNEKYGYSFTREDCIEFIEEDYSEKSGFMWHTVMDTPFVAVFEADGERVTVTDRKGFLSDDGQMEELNALVCSYFQEITGLEIEYVRIGDYFALGQLILTEYNARITPENMDDFMEKVWQIESLALSFYFAEEEDLQTQIDGITSKLAVLKEQPNLSSLVFYIRRSDAELPVIYREPFLEHRDDGYSDYRFGHYDVEENFYDLVDHFVKGGKCYLGRGQDGGFGLYDRVDYNGWCIATFRKVTQYERHHITDKVISTHHKTHGKLYSDAKLTEDFADDKVVITVYPFANVLTYTAEDFAEIGCVGIEEISEGKWEDKYPSRIIVLTLPKHDKQAVLDAISKLQERDDVYSAEPKYSK